MRQDCQERVGDVGVDKGWFGEDTGDGPAISEKAIEDLAIERLAIEKPAIKNLSVQELAIGKRPEFVAIDAG
ncbi:hypothetical protein [Bradyrhizobium sp.]|uniref:hypothetical protein n=1 Tax=Bradyrhizobium sp. TaxID=376 RepID=UPI003D0D6074